LSACTLSLFSDVTTADDIAFDAGQRSQRTAMESIAAITATVASVVSICDKCDKVLTRFAQAHARRNDQNHEVQIAQSVLAKAQGKMNKLRVHLYDDMAEGQRDDLRDMLVDVQVSADVLNQELDMPFWKYLVTADQSSASSAAAPPKLSWRKRMLKQAKKGTAFAASAALPEYEAAMLGTLATAVTALQAATDKVRLDDLQQMHLTREVYLPPRQLNEVMAKLQLKEGPHLILIAGGPAMGKSSLAREVMHRIGSAHHQAINGAQV
jgi:hypothetical protein